MAAANPLLMASSVRLMSCSLVRLLSSLASVTLVKVYVHLISIPPLTTQSLWILTYSPLV
jgi:hypothetical protein